ncbi:phosphoribosyltransferase domain-containing protein [Pseudomonas aeruginosa]|nr:phosphoribosyltransferase domain-containing protein [Pseudomonas aeruginosa]EKU7877388.1 phosphoribosyltransferase domain-containing protein [Pseudomonas aeruginosa]EKV3203868.1 phosphoribosyltransferase domain-containing protein [Pseudomonas aeruginosa]MBG6537452.1 phosphoribosyltransferase domain-containing protein [Pseudomonas aeruginosa]MBI7137035.1 phosphoribosyltransferase domain-containing protein [Pseudomonas aeruginosa]
MEKIIVPTSVRAQLKRGLLEVKVEDTVLPPADLFGFAERRNPKRAFLFVSKVLGRHIPVRPSVMAASFESLAAEIPPDLPGPVLVIGMAETAVGLGAGVHRAFSTTRSDSVYLISTRHPLGTDLFARFEEEHSHASAHLIHMPVDPEIREAMLQARSLVLVDDEASTGKTFVNLHRALVEAGLSKIERIVTCVLTDWSAGPVRKTIGESATAVSLMQGSYQFHENPAAPPPEMPDVGAVSIGEWPLSADKDWGRLGVRRVDDTLAPDIRVHPNEKVIVVGTSEFVWRPFLLAERLERAGVDVHFSSTTRSPIALGHAIEHALSFSDNYGLGIPNFLYNVKPGQFDRVLICSETPEQAAPAELVAALNAEVIFDGH